MSTAIRVGSGGVSEAFPPDRLGAEELTELRRLLAEWEQHDTHARALKDRVQLLLLVAKDRRGITGPVEIDPDTGLIVRISKEGSDG